MLSRTLSETEKELASHNEQLSSSTARLTEVKRLIKKSFEKNVDGLLPDDMFKELIVGYESEQDMLITAIDTATASINLLQSHTGATSAELEIIKKYADITELTRIGLTSLIKSIHISEAETVNGKKNYELDICYRFENNHAISEGEM